MSLSNSDLAQFQARLTGAGSALLDANGLLNLNEFQNLPLRVSSAGNTQMCFTGDSITAGTGGSIQPGVSSIIPYATGYVYSLRNMGFNKNGNTVWGLGMGSQRQANGLAQYTNSQGQQATITLTNGSTSGTITAIPNSASVVGGGSQNGFLITGAEVTGTGIAAHTTMALTTASTTAAITTGALTTMTVASSTGITIGMFVIHAAGAINGGLANNTVVTNVVGNVVTVSPAFSLGNNATINVYFINPTVAFSGAGYSGTTGSYTVTSGNTLITSTATFTANSATATVTGTTVGLSSPTIGAIVNSMGIGSASVPPGTSFTISGTTLTMSQKATASGSASFVASCITRDTASGTQLYPEGTNTTPHLLSHAVTGIASYFFDNYGINDAYDIVNSGASYATWQANKQALAALAHADGSTVIWLTIIPPTSSASFGFATVGPQVLIQNAWMRTRIGIDCDYLIDVAAKFPPGFPANDVYHSNDGIHPSDLGHALIAGTLNDQLFSQITPTAPLTQNPFSNCGLNENWLPITAFLTDRSNAVGGPANGSGASFPQSINGAVTITGNSTGIASLILAGPFGNGNPSRLLFQYYPSNAAGIAPTNGVLFQNDSSAGFHIFNYGDNRDKISFTSAGVLTLAGSPGGGGSTLTLSNNSVQHTGVALMSSGRFACGTSTDDGTNAAQINGGNIALKTVGNTLSLKGGSNARSGTVILASGVGTVTSTAITINDIVVLTLKTSSGTPGTYPPLAAVSAGSIAITGLATDNSTYNWAAFLGNQ